MKSSSLRKLSLAIQQFEHYSDLEILISDNNSEDETVSEIEKTIEASKPKNGCIKLKTKKIKGLHQIFGRSLIRVIQNSLCGLGLTT